MRKCITVITLLVLVCTANIQAADNPTFTVTAKDAVRAKVVFNKSSDTLLEVILTPRKAKELSTFTKANFMKTIDIKIGSELVASPQVRDEINGGTLQLAVKSDEHGIQLARYLAEREKKTPNQ